VEIRSTQKVKEVVLAGYANENINSKIAVYKKNVKII